MPRSDVVLGIMGVSIMVIPAFFLPFPLYFVGLCGSLLTIIPIVMYQKALSKKMFPTKLRIWEQRHNGLTVVKETRAKRITKDQQDYYVTIDGEIYKAPSQKYVIQGVGDNYVDLFTQSGEHYPMVPDQKSVNEVQHKIIPEDQKYWLATQIEENIQATTPEKSRWEKAMPILIVAVTGIILTVMIVSFLQYFPEFVQRTTGVMNAQIKTLNNITTQLVEAVKTLKAVKPATTTNPVW